MRVKHCRKRLERLECEKEFTGGYSQDVVTAFRKRLRLIRDAKDERDFPNLNSIGFEPLKGNRQNQYSMKLPGGLRLILELDHKQVPTLVRIVEIVDYHHRKRKRRR